MKSMKRFAADVGVTPCSVHIVTARGGMAKIGPQRQNDAPAEPRLGKLLRHTRNAQSDSGKRNEQVVSRPSSISG